jgi:hypothetical protein
MEVGNSFKILSVLKDPDGKTLNVDTEWEVTAEIEAPAGFESHGRWYSVTDGGTTAKVSERFKDLAFEML